ncbi:hypothetical protein PT2222_70014 [Paraburkholderia tropica]
MSLSVHAQCASSAVRVKLSVDREGTAGRDGRQKRNAPRDRGAWFIRVTSAVMTVSMRRRRCLVERVENPARVVGEPVRAALRVRADDLVPERFRAELQALRVQAAREQLQIELGHDAERARETMRAIGDQRRGAARARFRDRAGEALLAAAMRGAALLRGGARGGDVRRDGVELALRGVASGLRSGRLRALAHPRGGHVEHALHRARHRGGRDHRAQFGDAASGQRARRPGAEADGGVEAVAVLFHARGVERHQPDTLGGFDHDRVGDLAVGHEGRALRGIGDGQRDRAARRVELRGREQVARDHRVGGGQRQRMLTEREQHARGGGERQIGAALRARHERVEQTAFVELAPERVARAAVVGRFHAAHELRRAEIGQHGLRRASERVVHDVSLGMERADRREARTRAFVTAAFRRVRRAGRSGARGACARAAAARRIEAARRMAGARHERPWPAPASCPALCSASCSVACPFALRPGSGASWCAMIMCRPPEVFVSRHASERGLRRAVSRRWRRRARNPL